MQFKQRIRRKVTVSFHKKSALVYNLIRTARVTTLSVSIGQTLPGIVFRVSFPEEDLLPISFGPANDDRLGICHMYIYNFRLIPASA